MNKKVKLFEAFAGIGSQYRALNNISKKKHWDIEVVGMIEWFIPAISAYIEIHSDTNVNKYVNSNKREEIKDIAYIFIRLFYNTLKIIIKKKYTICQEKKN